MPISVARNTHELKIIRLSSRVTWVETVGGGDWIDRPVTKIVYC